MKGNWIDMVEKFYELTEPQKSIWNMEKFFEDTTINNICASVTILDELDEDALKEAIHHVVKKNDSFRTRIVIQEDTPVQYFCDFEPFDIEVIHIDKVEQFEKIKEEMIDYHFEMIHSPLYCFKILKFQDGHGIFIFTVHHIIADSWSLGLFTKSVMKEYQLLIHHSDILLEANSYTDFIQSESAYLQSNKYQKDKAYFQEEFGTIPEKASFPSYSSTQNNYLASRQSFPVGAQLAPKIQKFCEVHKISVFNFFMAVYAIYLGRTNQLDEFVMGVPILNRTNPREKATMGMFVNTIPVKVSLKQDEIFIDFVHRLSVAMIGNLKHQKYSYLELLENLRVQNPSISNLYDVVISYQVTKAVDKEDGDYHIDWYPTKYSSADCVVQITDLNDNGELLVNYDYLEEKYSEKEIRDLHDRITHMIEQALAKKELFLSNIEVVTNEEKDKILCQFNDTAVNFPNNENLLDLFEKHVQKAPKSTAVIFENKKLSYQELDEKSSIMASYLKENGVTNTDVVAILLDRSLELIVSIFGIIKSGASFVLIDPSFPEDRIQYILRDCEAKFCICNTNPNLEKSTAKLISTKECIENAKLIDNLPFSSQLFNNLCIIYTSGSTGEPKGVLLNKSGYYNLLNAFEMDFQLSQYHNILGIASVSFDMFVFEVLASISFGNTLVLANHLEQKDPIATSNLIKRNHVDFLVITPSRAELLLMEECNHPFQEVKAILFGGEKFTNSLLARLREATNAKIFNSFGPTEITSACTNKLITSETITIGKPLSNMQIYICDTNLKLLPIGTIGEICVGGKGVSNGYLNKSETTKEHFVKNPFGKNFIYRTGDLGRYLENGELEYIGRLDDQVKLRGLRIELGEIENKLGEIPEVHSCVVVKRTDHHHREFLCAYFSASNPLDTKGIRRTLEQSLPKYMVPSYFVQLEKLPHTANGKIDKKNLPEPEYQVSSDKLVLPRNSADEKFITILKGILKVPEVSLDDSFFELGGDSLLAINLSIKVQSEFGVHLSVKEIIENPIVRDLADIIGTRLQMEVTVTEEIKTSGHESYYKASFAQKRIYYSSLVSGENSLVYNTPGGIILEGYVDTKKLEDCFIQLIDRHEALRTYFEIHENELVQKMEEHIDFHLKVQNGKEFDEMDTLFQEFVKPFHLEKAPLFRVELVQFTNRKICNFLRCTSYYF